MGIFGQLNPGFGVGLAGATIVSLGLFTLSRHGDDIQDNARAKPKATSECVSGRLPITGTSHSDSNVIAFALPRIEFDNR